MTAREALWVITSVALTAVACGEGGIDLGRGGLGGLDASDVAEPACGVTDDDGDGIFDLCDPCPGDAGNDVDGDGICAAGDNCPTMANAEQVDGDDDGNGDACDCPIGPDQDGDGACDDIDPCPLAAPAAGGDPLADGDGDGLGDGCDPCFGAEARDGDGDGACDDADVCPDLVDDQADADRDGAGDACDPCPLASPDDRDGDGVCDDVDPCAVASELARDGDLDGLDDACESCPDDPWNDDDGDGVCGLDDICPFDADPDQGDADGDGVGDACDVCPAPGAGPDGDGDGACDAQDNCALVANRHQLDIDGDGIGTACDPDEVMPASFGAGGSVSQVRSRGATAAVYVGQELHVIHADVATSAAAPSAGAPFIDADERVWIGVFAAGGGALLRETPTRFASVGRRPTTIEDGPDGGVVTVTGNAPSGTLEHWVGAARATIAESAWPVYVGPAPFVDSVTTTRRVGGSRQLHRWTSDGGDEHLESAWALMQVVAAFDAETLWMCAAREDGASEIFLVRDGRRVATSTLTLPEVRLCRHGGLLDFTTGQVFVSQRRATPDGDEVDVWYARPEGPLLLTSTAASQRASFGPRNADVPMIGIGCADYGERACHDFFVVEGDAVWKAERVWASLGAAVGPGGTLAAHAESANPPELVVMRRETVLRFPWTPQQARVAVAPDTSVWTTDPSGVWRQRGTSPPELVFAGGSFQDLTLVTRAGLLVAFAGGRTGLYDIVDGEAVDVDPGASAVDVIGFDATTNEVSYARWTRPDGGASVAESISRWDRDTGVREALVQTVAYTRRPGASDLLVQRTVDGPWFRARVPSTGALVIDETGHDRPADHASTPGGTWYLEEAGAGTGRLICPVDPARACIALATPLTSWASAPARADGRIVLMGRDAEQRWHLVRSID